jgi:general secretion pathway protein D
LLLVALHFGLAACAQPVETSEGDLRTLPYKAASPASLAPARPLIAGSSQRTTNVRAGPAPPAAPEDTVRPEAAVRLSGEPVSVTAEQMPLLTFINTIFGDTLHLTFQVDPRVAQRTDMVTLRTGRALPPDQLLALTRAVLRDYGISITFTDNVARILPNEALLQQSPNVIRGRGTAETSESLRPIYQYLSLSNVSAADMVGWLQSAFGPKLRISPAAQSNAILLLGLPDDVQAANDAVRALDQPRLAGRRSIRIEPSFWPANQLAEKLSEILRAEGYSVSTSLQTPSALIVLSLRPSNSVVVFGNDQKTLAHVEEWARDLDRGSQVDPQRSLFYYGVRNTTAQSLANVLNAVLQNSNPTRAPGVAGPPEGVPPDAPPSGAGGPAAAAAAAAAPTGPPPGGGLTGRIVTDPARNAIIFQGSAQEFGQLRPLIENLDQPAREVIIEATVAEVTLGNDETLGVEGILSLGPASLPHEVISSTGTGIGTNGLNIAVLAKGGLTKARLNALASTNRVRVLSTPKILSRSGGEARIQVGAQVPIVTSQGTSSQLQQQGTSAILQSIQYRDTGVILTVKPTIYAGNQVDLEIKQEVSQAVQNDTSGLSTPVISNRTVATQLSLEDGATVLLGGLITDNATSTNSGIPVLQDIPGIGFLFGTQRVTKARTELFVFITPYIIASPTEAARLTDIFKDRLQSLPQPNSTLHW